MALPAKSKPLGPDQAAAKAAAAVADGFVDPAPTAAATAATATATAATAVATAATDPVAAVRQAQHVDMTAQPQADLEAALASAESGFVAPEPHIVIVAAKPGFRRAGITHPSRAQYPLDYFTRHQLDQIEAEPMLQLIAVGGAPVARPAYAHSYQPVAPIDPRAAGQAAADAISRGPNRAEPGLRNAAVRGGRPT